ncbi:hypothetical protein [Bradyrhizobium genosp. P]|uniref:hypothetical protein n=1 Tax=Bradyrhizobium genosp. P TaxID=83641 RepID=UPI003CF3E5A7
MPHQGRTLHASDPAGTPLEFCATMLVVPRMITKFTRHAGGAALRLDHTRVLTPEVRKACEFYMAAGFRLSEYIALADTSICAAYSFSARKIRTTSYSSMVRVRGCTISHS